jgi:hypothetical protein
LEPTKANQWTRRLTKLSVLIGYGMGTGCAICFGGPYFGNDQKGTDVILMTGASITAISCAIGGATTAYGVWEIRALQRTISTVSSTGKALKVMVPLLAAMAVVLGCCITPFWFGIALIPWVRERAFVFFYGACTPIWIIFHGLGVYELQQLRKRQAAQMRQRQIIPSASSIHKSNTQTNAIADTVAATKQALLSNEQQRHSARRRKRGAAPEIT